MSISNDKDLTYASEELSKAQESMLLLLENAPEDDYLEHEIRIVFKAFRVTQRALADRLMELAEREGVAT